MNRSQLENELRCQQTVQRSALSPASNCYVIASFLSSRSPPGTVWTSGLHGGCRQTAFRFEHWIHLPCEAKMANTAGFFVHGILSVMF